jgi:hypothetical protein
MHQELKLGDEATNIPDIDFNAALATDIITVETIARKLQHKMLIVRQRGIEEVNLYLNAQHTQQASFQESLGLLGNLSLRLGNSSHWQLRQSGFWLARAIVPVLNDQSFYESVLALATGSLGDPEARVRVAVGEALGQLTRTVGLGVYISIKPMLFLTVETNFTRDEEAQAMDRAKTADLEAMKAQHLNSGTTSSPQPARSRRDSSDSLSLLGSDSDREAGGDEKKRVLWDLPKGKHDTEGWQALETSFQTLHRIIEAAGPSFRSELMPPHGEVLVGLLTRAAAHTNRFVRETAYLTCGAIAQAVDSDAATSLAVFLIPLLVTGLSDNWSQVRYSASIATRQFLVRFPGVCIHYYPILVPPMCMNRYYVAKGVQLYSLETWQLCFGTEGKRIVAENVATIAPFYVAQANADNHAVREAACHCIAELASKVGGDLDAFLPPMLEALLMCFKDESWPVRDAACKACAAFVAAYPNQSRAVLESDLYALWFQHVSDNIPSVRAGSCAALGQVMDAYGESAIERVLEFLRNNVASALQQSNDSKRNASLSNTTTFGVAKRIRDNDEHLHTDQTMFSCGSLAPKLRRGGGCMDHSFKRKSEPWETSDGCLYLLSELASRRPALLSQFMESVLRVCRPQDYIHHAQVLTTFCAQLPLWGKSLGKINFKRLLTTHEALLEVVQ